MNEKLPQITAMSEAAVEIDGDGKTAPDEEAAKKAAAGRFLSAWNGRDALPPSGEIRAEVLRRRERNFGHPSGNADEDGRPRRMRTLPDGTVYLMSDKEFDEDAEVRAFRKDPRNIDPAFDADGNPRQLRELPDSTVAMLSDKEYAREMEDRDRDIGNKLPVEHPALERLSGAGPLSDHIRSGSLPKPPDPNWLR